jgi:hypothetical protein
MTFPQRSVKLLALALSVHLETGEDRRRWDHCLLRRDERSDLEDGWHHTAPSPQRVPRDVQGVQETRPRFPGMVSILT